MIKENGIIIAQLKNMERRAFERVATILPVKYVCDDIQYSGSVKNLSEKGMYISTGNFLPCIKKLEIIIPLQEEISKFYGEIKRIEKIDDAIYSMGVELLGPPDNYTQFVENLRLTMKG